MSPERRRGYAMSIALSIAGLISGVLTDCVLGSWYVEGGVFGVAMTVGLVSSGALGYGRAIPLIISSVGGFASSFWAAICVRVFLPIQWPMGDRHVVANLPSMFVAGAVGGFIVLCGALSSLCPGLRARQIAREALAWSPIPGLLGVSGWALAPSLGEGLSRFLSGMHVPRAGFFATSPASAWDAYFMYSVPVVWQAGMGLVLAIVAQRHAPIGKSTERRP